MALGKKILITGANGFLGSQLAVYLASQGYEVIGAVRDKSKTEHLRQKNIVVTQTDYGKDFVNLINDVDVLVHAAALLASSFKSNKHDFYKANVELTGNLLKQASKANLRRFIFISSVGLYGSTNGKRVSESEKASGKLSLYERTKHEAEKSCIDFFGKTPVVILRLSQLYGPTMKYGWPEVFKQILNNKFYILGKGKGTIQPLYIDDAVRAIEKVIAGRGKDGQIYNLAGGNTVTLDELFNHMAKILRTKPIRHLPYYPVLILSYLLKLIPASIKPAKLNLLSPHNVSFFSQKRSYDITKAKTELDFNPIVDIEEGLTETINSWKTGK